MDVKSKEMLEQKAKDIRVDIVEMLCAAGSGHPGGSLSLADVFSYLYFSGVLNIDPKDPGKKDRDRVVLSKGHACPVLYATLAEKGYFDKGELKTLRKYGSMLQGHPDMNKTPGVDMTTGSLGQGLSCAVGMALAAKLDSSGVKVFAILGDGECDEGQIWEAAMAARHYRLDNLIAIVDLNGLQIDGFTKDIMDTTPMAEKWRSFGWKTYEIDGHDLDVIEDTVGKAISVTGSPVCIVANTTKGKGVTFMENACDWHGNAPSEEEKDRAICDICKIDAS
ncbi:MAG: transketolase [Actinomycetota bacterium]|nr:MAG: transketolase [Actinomycetota bacterium]